MESISTFLLLRLQQSSVFSKKPHQDCTPDVLLVLEAFSIPAVRCLATQVSDIWVVIHYWVPSFYSCDRSVFYSIFTFAVCTLIAQVALTARSVVFLWLLNDTELISEHYRRIYAVTMKNVPIAVGFAVITASQLALGICLVSVTAKRKSEDKLWTRKDRVSLRASLRLCRLDAPTNTC